MKPAVSVLVPICNVQRYLRECLESLVNQTLRNMEFILINDGSTDDSLSIVREFERKDARIVVIDKPNSGYGDSMNRGLELACGEYVGIVESDDFAAPEMFERLYEAAKEHDVDVVRSNFYAYSTTGEDGPHEEFVENLVGCVYGRPISPLECQTVFLCRPAIWTGLYRRSFLEENEVRFLPTPGASFQDTGFCFKLLFAADEVLLLKDGFLRYRVDNDGSSVKSQKKVFPICEEYAEIWRYAQRDASKFEAIKRRIPYQQFGGYRWNLERLVPQIRHQFYLRMVDEFERIGEAGLLDEGHFDKLAWRELADILADPKEHYRQAYGPVEVRSTVVACVAGLERELALKWVGALLDATQDDDEVVVVHEDSRDIVSSAKASGACAGRVYDDSDFVRPDLMRTFDVDRVRGNRLLVILASGNPEAEMMKTVLARSAAEEGVIVERLAGGGVIVSFERDGLVSDSASQPSSLPLLLLRSFALRDSGAAASFAGLCGGVVAQPSAEEYAKSVEGWVAFAHELFSSSLEYAQKRSVFQAALPAWNRVRRSFGLLSDADARLARDAYESMADAPCLEAPGQEGPERSDAPKVSVIVPVHNAMAYLEECIASILCQEVEGLEVVFVNDGSPDGSLSILEELARKDRRVRVVSQFNCGAGAARNRGIGLARGGVLAFMDPDDYYPGCNALSTLLEAMGRSGSLVCGGSFSLVRPTGVVQKEFPFSESFYRSDAEREVCLARMWNDYGWIRFAYDARLFRDGRVRFPQLGWYEDPVFFMRAVEAAGGVHVVPDVVYRYRVDYKEIAWSASKVRDLLDGIAENLALAARNDMAELYTTLVGRIDSDYYEPIVGHLDDEGVCQRLLSIQASLRVDLILPVREQGRGTYVLRPLGDRLKGSCGTTRDTAVVRLARKVERSGLYEGIQRLIWRAKGQEVPRS